MEMRRFTVADLHDVMAHPLSLPEGRHLDIFVRTKGIVRGNFRQVDLFEFRPVLQEDVGDRGA